MINSSPYQFHMEEGEKQRLASLIRGATGQWKRKRGDPYRPFEWRTCVERCHLFSHSHAPPTAFVGSSFL